MKPSAPLHFNALPLATRQSLTESLAQRGPCPALLVNRANHFQNLGHGLTGVVAGLGTLVGLLAPGAGELSPDGFLYHPGRLLGYGLGVGMLAWGALGFLRELNAHRQRQACAAPDGIYVFPGRILEVEDGWIRSRDLAGLTGLKVTDHRTNGLHTHTSFVFEFGPNLDDPRVKLRFGKRWEAAEALQAWEVGRLAYLTRLEAGMEVDDLDPLAGVDLGQGSEPRAVRPLEGPSVPEPMPPLLRPTRRRGLRLNLALAGAALLAGLLIWGGDSALGDLRAFQQVRQQDQSAAYRLYADQGLLHRGEVATRLLPAALLREALASGKVQPLRAFIREFPTFAGTAQARQALDATFDQAQSRWLQAATVDPQAKAGLLALFQAMRQPGHDPIPVRFTRPETKVLEAMDQALGGELVSPAGQALAILDRSTKAPLEAVAPHFKPDAWARHEEALVRAFAGAFEQVLGADLISLERREASPSLPCLRIDIRIEPTDRRFEGSHGRLTYVGLRFTFEVRLDLPGQPEALHLPLKVEPGETFHVAYSRKTQGGAVSTFQGQPTGSEVYGAMTREAIEAAGKAFGKGLMGHEGRDSR